jgi:WD40 repeat protein
MTHEAAQRYRAAIKQIDVLPAGCKEWQPKERADFQAWRKITMEERVKDQAEGVTGDRPLKLDPPLRPSLWRIRFSPDGRYILAQDESSITVVDKDAGKDLFRIDASDAQGAQFTPDSSSVVFHDDKLRVEQWSVASAKRISVKELVVFDGCTQTLLTQDGKTLMCAKLSSHYGSLRVGIKLIDVESGKSFFEIPNYYEPGYYDEAGGLQALASNFLGGYNIVNVAASPGGRYLIMSAGIKILAYDLQNRQAVALRGKLKDLDQTRITFLGPDQVFVVGKRLDKFFYEGLILSFPDGRLVKKSKIGPEQFAAVTKGQNLLVWPLKDYGIGILDPNQEKISIASKYTAMDAWDNSVATESARGGLELVQLGAQGTKRIPLPLGPLPRPQAAVFSPDGKFLALSMKGRASIWNMETGKQVGLLRPFSSAWIDDGDQLYGQFPKFITWDPKELQISMTTLASTELAKLDKDVWQFHEMELRFKPLAKGKEEGIDTALELKKMQTQTVAWSRNYLHERPACWPAEDNRLVLAWDLSSDTAKEEIKSHPELQPQVNALKNKKKGMLIETVVPETGAPLQQVIIPEVDLTDGWDDIRRAMVSDKFVLVRGEHGNTAIYRMDSGAKVGEFFGLPLATNAAMNLIAASNRANEILLVDEQTGKEIKRFMLGSPVITAHIVAGKDKELFVLTDDQVLHRLPLP